MSNYYSYLSENSQKKKESFCFNLISIFLLAVFLTALIVLFLSFISSSENNKNFIKHEIKAGESFWSIANIYYNSNNVDLRRIVYEIKKINGIDTSVINPGKRIIIPLD